MLPIEAYVPHRGAMLLIDRLLEADENQAVAEATIPADGMFVREGRVPGWVGIEYMAQTISAWSGARMRREGCEPRSGLLLGTRRYDAQLADFPVGMVLRVEARQEFIGANGLGLFECRILVEGKPVATARLNIYEPENGLDFANNGTFP